MPPHRQVDHQKVLKEGEQPICLRSYRYKALQKDVIEKLNLEFLDSGVIQPSQSPFSSPLVLVRKKKKIFGECVLTIEG